MVRKPGDEQSRPGGLEQDVGYRWLKERIASVPRNVGVLITEAEVSRETGIGRTPVREALLRMETEGYLQILPRKGAFIPPISDADIVAVMEARGLIEDWCVRRAVPQPRLPERLESMIETQRRLLGNPAEFIDQDRLFHRVIVRSAGNPFLADFYETLRDRQVRMGMKALAAVEDRAKIVLDEHEAIVTALRDRDIEAAAVAVSAHLARTLSALQMPEPAHWLGFESEDDPVGPGPGQ